MPKIVRFNDDHVWYEFGADMLLQHFEDGLCGGRSVAIASHVYQEGETLRLYLGTVDGKEN